MSTDWASENFATLSAKHFEPLCEGLGLSGRNTFAGTGYAISSAASGNVQVFFEHDRGICHFSVGLAGEAKPFCEVELIARRFPRIRLLSKGEQRLSLNEQAELLKNHWNELQHMFGPALADTHSWLAEVRAETTARYSGGA
jgi:hypothetical protein